MATSLFAAGGLAFDRDGEIVERSPARENAVTAIATCLASRGGAALIIDYGHERTAPGDTLQAVSGHRYVPTLVDPGEQDLTAHVDFEALGTAAVEAGSSVTPAVGQELPPALAHLRATAPPRPRHPPPSGRPRYRGSGRPAASA
mgnify:CR=1 FL=1